MTLRARFGKRKMLRYSRKEYEEMEKGERERELRMNVYGTISKTMGWGGLGVGNRKTSTLIRHQETKPHHKGKHHNFLQHPFYSWQLRSGCGHRSTWSSDPVQVNLLSHMPLLLTVRLPVHIKQL
jgi:hypothetical protein